MSSDTTNNPVVNLSAITANSDVIGISGGQLYTRGGFGVKLTTCT